MSLNQHIKGSLDLGNPLMSYTCTVHKPDSNVEYYEAYKNIGRKYTRIAYGTDASTVIQAAVDSLASGDIYIKKGTYIITTVITVYGKPINFFLEGGAILKREDTSYLSALINVGFVGAKVGIYGGEFDCNKGAGAYVGTVNLDAITAFSNAEELILRDVYIHDTITHGVEATIDNITVDNCIFRNIGSSQGNNMGHGIYFGGSENVRIVNNYFETIWTAGIMLKSVKKAYVGGNTAKNTSQNGANVYAFIGICLNGGSIPEQIDIEGNVGESNYDNYISIGAGKHICVKGGLWNAGGGYGITVSPVTPDDVIDLLIEGVNLYNGVASGISINDKCSDVQLLGNNVHDFSSYGIHVASNNTQIINNRAWNNGGLDVLRVGIWLNAVTGCIVTGNFCNDFHDPTKYQRYGIYENGACDYNIIKNNDVRYNRFAGMLLVGANDIVESNLGWTTENSGTATISASTSVVFAHGLVGTPTHVAVGFKTTGYGSWIWSADATNITITVAVSGTYDLTWDAEYTL